MRVKQNEAIAEVELQAQDLAGSVESNRMEGSDHVDATTPQLRALPPQQSMPNGLGPARGILISVMLGGLIWVGVLTTVWRLVF